jgi:hypothetical protein
LSFAQQRLWFLDQLVPGNAFYNVDLAMRVPGALNVPALEQSLNEIVRRHDALRTTFKAVEGQAVQVVAPTLHVPLPVVELSALPAAAREARVQSWRRPRRSGRSTWRAGRYCGRRCCGWAPVSTCCC